MEDKVKIYVLNKFFEVDKASALYAVENDGAIIVDEENESLIGDVKKRRDQEEAAEMIAKSNMKDFALQEKIKKFNSNIDAYMAALDKLLDTDKPDDDEDDKEDKPDDDQEKATVKKSSKKKSKNKKE